LSRRNNIAAIQRADSTDEMQHSHLFLGSSGAPLPERLGQPLSLWGSWWNAIQSLRPAFSRLRAFMWFATIVAGMTVRTELLGVTSIVRALNLRPNLYNPLRKHFHSSAVKLDRLSALWVQAVLRLFPSPVSVNGRGFGRGWYQGPQTRQEDAGRQAFASAIGIQHQARVHHGAFHAGHQLTGNRG
jgi:hypothetical protein